MSFHEVNMSGSPCKKIIKEKSFFFENKERTHDKNNPFSKP